MRRALIGSALAALLLGTAATAAASGPPPTTTTAGHGVVALGGGATYLARPRGGRTLVERVARSGARRERVVPGRFGVPAVAQDGSASGLSADERTLVLASRPGAVYPPRRTTYLILDAATLRVRERVTLAGNFGFDAISPDGGTLYLIRYRGGNPTDYAVRAYDVHARRLLAKPIIDPREPDEQMRGFPLTRTVSHDGVWAYTLYGGSDGTPFIHALDTRDRTARCIDVPQLGTSGDIGAQRLRLSPDGGRLTVADGSTAVAFVDTVSFRVSSPPLPALPAAPAPTPAAAHGGGGPPWRLIGGLALALLLAGIAVAAATRRGRGPGATQVRPD
jgi:hypothetical protein